MDYRQISIQLLEKLGGKENISSNAACMTRLRVGIPGYVQGGSGRRQKGGGRSWSCGEQYPADRVRAGEGE